MGDDGKVVNINDARYNPRKALADATKSADTAEISVVLTLRKDGTIDVLHSEAHTSDLTHILKYFDLHVTEQVYHENFVDGGKGEPA